MVATMGVKAPSAYSVALLLSYLFMIVRLPFGLDAGEDLVRGFEGDGHDGVAQG